MSFDRKKFSICGLDTDLEQVRIPLKGFGTLLNPEPQPGNSVRNHNHFK
jgi:hypothetical protein